MELSERNLKALHDAGYKIVYEVFDDPNITHPSHTHDTDHEIIITEGSMQVHAERNVDEYGVGDQFIIPANTKHFVRIGSDGCKYVIGE